MRPAAPGNPLLSRVLNAIERLGNLLPDPAVLFVFGALVVMALSQVGASLGWEVQPVRPERVVDPASGAASVRLAAEGEPIRPVSLLTSSGLGWAISSMIKNFLDFPPLGVVLVGMLGVGVAERTGLIAAALKAAMLGVPVHLMTPVVVFVGINASLAADAGFIVLPPLAAALYRASGRSPLAGVAAVFGGLSGGFCANMLITSLDPVFAGLTEAAARIADPSYTVNAACNWWFKIASTVLLTGVGWLVTAWVVEPRLASKTAAEGGPTSPTADDLAGQGLASVEAKALVAAGVALVAVLGLVIACVLIPGSPLYGADPSKPAGPARWVAGIVPILFFAFLLPGIVFGVRTGTVRGGGDVTRMMVESMAAMAPIIVMAFFAGQFIAYFKYSNLGEMLAMTGGKALASSGLGHAPLMVLFILAVILLDMLVVSASAKYTLIAPIFVPMFMMAGISPELTQAAYRVGDSVVNPVSPLNPYLVIILAVIQKYAPRAGIGTLLSMMLPYSLAFGAAWIALLLLWMAAGAELGLGGPLTYSPQ
jgi:aminobenzoyl-glutamate transport protein